MIPTQIKFVGVLFITLSVMCFAATYEIPHSSIGDHSNPATTGSIAWYFVQYGASNTYNLSTSTTYYINDTITIPAGATLGEKTGITAVIRANSGCSEKAMVNLNNWSCVRDLELHANRYAKHCVYASGKTGPQVRSCTLHKTKNDYPADSDPRLHLIVYSSCNQGTITGSLMRRAGCDPKVNGSTWDGLGTAIYAPNCNILNITWNDIALTLTGGIDFTGSMNVNVLYNDIHDIGLNSTYLGYGFSDGITAYHNLLGTTDLNNQIKYNAIWSCYNHGIHVSGYDVHIEENEIYDVWNYNVMLGDWRTEGGQDCSSDCTITNNYFPNCPDSGNNSISVSEYVNGTITVSGNTGCNSVNWKTATICD